MKPLYFAVNYMTEGDVGVLNVICCHPNRAEARKNGLKRKPAGSLIYVFDAFDAKSIHGLTAFLKAQGVPSHAAPVLAADFYRTLEQMT